MTNRERNLFQACATVAAGGYVRGPSISFGWPRPDGSSYLKALKRVYKMFKDGTPHRRPRPSASDAVKDNGIDIIAWRRTADQLPGTHYMVAQVASGKDWIDKSVVQDREHFHKFWFKYPSASTSQDAMFMPFGLEPEIPANSKSYKAVLHDHVSSVGYRFGTLFYRDRLARSFADGARLIAEGETEIERYEELPQIVRWVNNYSRRLQTI